MRPSPAPRLALLVLHRFRFHQEAIALAQKLNGVSLCPGFAWCRHHELLRRHQGALEPHGLAALAGEGRDDAVAAILHGVIGDAVQFAELQALGLYRMKTLGPCDI
jgi:hypothetical protein